MTYGPVEIINTIKLKNKEVMILMHRIIRKIDDFLKLPFLDKLDLIKAKLAKAKTHLFYRFFFRDIGAGSVIRSPLLLRNSRYVTLGKRVFIRDGIRIEGVSNWNGENYFPELIIEDNVSIEQNCHIIFANKMIIGANTTISFGVMITDIDHEYREIGVHILKQPLITRTTIIGENCFIGSGAKIQAGTILGKHCVIGANAVVRGEFPDYCVIVGAPAKIVKRYNVKSCKWVKTNSKGEFLDEI